MDKNPGIVQLDTLTLIFSWRCPVACDHCGFGCGPHRKGRLLLEDALGYIETASKNPHIKMIAFSGGEPFLFYEDVKICLLFSQQRGLVGGITTNCYWALDSHIAEKRLTELACAGLQEMIVSLDDYHAAFIPTERVKRVVHAALKAGVRIGINILANKKSKIRVHEVSTLLDIPREVMSNSKCVWIRESSPILTGRAFEKIEDSHFITYDESGLLGVPCSFIVRDMVITPKSELFACCGFGNATRNSPSAFTYVGDLKSESLDVLCDKAIHNLLFTLLSQYGPCFLLKLAKDECPSLTFRREFVSPCEVCNEIGNNMKLRQVIAGILKNSAEQSLAKRAKGKLSGIPL